MPRLFVALEMSDEVKAHIAELQMGMPQARWTRREQLHLTLRFIGDVPGKRVKAIKLALEGVKAEPFDMRLRELGRFPPRGKPRVLSALADDCPPLLDLQAQIEEAVVSAGVEREGRRFSPHVTIARFKTPPSHNLMGRYMKPHERFVTENMRITEFILYSSVLSPKGARHTREAVYYLE